MEEQLSASNDLLDMKKKHIKELEQSLLSKLKVSLQSASSCFVFPYVHASVQWCLFTCVCAMVSVYVRVCNGVCLRACVQWCLFTCVCAMVSVYVRACVQWCLFTCMCASTVVHY